MIQEFDMTTEQGRHTWQCPEAAYAARLSSE
jgi:hypothetical protein